MTTKCLKCGIDLDQVHYTPLCLVNQNHAFPAPTSKEQCKACEDRAQLIPASTLHICGKEQKGDFTANSNEIGNRLAIEEEEPQKRNREEKFDLLYKQLGLHLGYKKLEQKEKLKAFISHTIEEAEKSAYERGLKDGEEMGYKGGLLATRL